MKLYLRKYFDFFLAVPRNYKCASASADWTRQVLGLAKPWPNFPGSLQNSIGNSMSLFPGLEVPKNGVYYISIQFICHNLLKRNIQKVGCFLHTLCAMFIMYKKTLSIDMIIMQPEIMIALLTSFNCIL